MIKAFIDKVETYVDLDLTPPSVIFEIGSRDCIQSIEFASRFPASMVYAFEPNPLSIPQCRTNVMYMENVKLVEKCVFDHNGKITFRPMNKELTVTTWPDGNQGAASVFPASGLYDAVEKYVQDEVEVDCTRIDTFIVDSKIRPPDLVWMDAQGAELAILKGFGDFLGEVTAIQTELCAKPMYTGQSLFPEVNEYLEYAGFVRVTNMPDNPDWFWTDFVYINKRHMR